MHSFQKLGVCWYQLEFFDNAVTFPSQSRASFADHTYVIQTVTGTFSIQLQDAICIRPSGVIGNLTYVEIGQCFTMVFCSTLGSEVSVASSCSVANVHVAAHCAAQFRLPLGEIIVIPITSFWSLRLKYMSFGLSLCV